MCRPKELGGRRCPQHTDPVKHAAYNARRRELYAQGKRTPEAVIAAFDYSFPAMDALRVNLTNEEETRRIENAVALAKKIIPGYDYQEAQDVLWSADHRDYQRDLEPNQALLFYTGGQYRLVRKVILNPTNKLDGKKIMVDEDFRWMQRTLTTMDSAIAAAEEPEEPRLVYRGMRLDPNASDEEIDAMVDKGFPVGGVISQENYMSTTQKPSVAYLHFGDGFTNKSGADSKRSVVMEIMTRKGAPLTYGTSHASQYEAENSFRRQRC
jgi:hypothetical protein